MTLSQTIKAFTLWEFVKAHALPLSLFWVFLVSGFLTLTKYS
jgi:hypothetical protein